MQRRITNAVLKRNAVILAVYLGVFVGLDFVAAQFEVARGVSLWYPPAAASVVLLLLFGLRWTPALAISVILHSAIVTRVGLTWWHVAILAVVTATSFGAAAWILTRRLGVDPRLATLRDVLWFGFWMCLAASVTPSVVQLWLLDAAGSIGSSEFVNGVAGLWAGAATGVAMVAPVVLVATRRWRRDEAFEPDLPATILAGTGRLEAVAQAIVLGGAVWVAFASDRASLDFGYLVYPPLIWIALRGGFFRSVIAVAATNIAAVALNGGRIPDNGGFALQFGLVSLTLLGVTLGAAVAQRNADGERSLRASLRDPLTGLANRTLLDNRLRRALNPSHTEVAHRKSGALLLLDLDRFKQINDGLGHGAGDDVLVEVARRLSSEVRNVDTVARLGGDEFAVLLDGIDPAEVDDTAQRILDAVNTPLETSAGMVHPTVSVGSVIIGQASRHGERDDSTVPTERLLHHGDIALHRAKQQGRDRHVAFDNAMREQAVLLQAREVALREAFDTGEITVVFQPIVEVPSRRVVAAEALARWNRPDGTSISATDLIIAAESSNQINRLGHEVLTQACRAATTWPEHMRLAVNVSAIELQHHAYAASVIEILEAPGFAANRLELEITATQWVSEFQPSTATLTEAGVRLALDDFGTGFSSISHLHDMSVNTIKIDRSYVSSLTTDARSIGIVNAIFCIAEQLGLDVTAEGVETEAHWQFLVEHGCNFAQGYLLGRPQPQIPPTAQTPHRPTVV